MSATLSEWNTAPKLPAKPQPTEIEEFEYSTYARCSDNNMPCFTSFIPLTEEEQREAEAALRLNKTKRG